METKEIDIKEVFKEVYKVEDIVLSETQAIRTLFRATVNPRGIHGTIIYQKKDKSGNWIDEKGLDKRNFRAGEWTKIDIDSDEMGKIIGLSIALNKANELKTLPLWNHYLITGMTLGLSDSDIEILDSTIQKDPQILSKIVDLAKAGQRVSDQIGAINTEMKDILTALKGLNATDLNTIKNAIQLLNINIDDLVNLIENKAPEETFQTFFKENPEILQIIIPSLIHVIDTKPYYGGKGLDGKGGTYGDFIAKERNNLVFIEIKTPECTLVQNETYRNGLSKISTEIVNAVIQVKNEKHSFYREFAGDSKYDNTFYDGRCYVIAGQSSSLDNNEKINTFELYKSTLSNIT